MPALIWLMHSIVRKWVYNNKTINNRTRSQNYKQRKYKRTSFGQHKRKETLTKLWKSVAINSILLFFLNNTLQCQQTRKVKHNNMGTLNQQNPENTNLKNRMTEKKMT
jgi:hypothetical protein